MTEYVRYTLPCYAMLFHIILYYDTLLSLDSHSNSIFSIGITQISANFSSQKSGSGTPAHFARNLLPPFFHPFASLAYFNPISSSTKEAGRPKQFQNCPGALQRAFENHHQMLSHDWFQKTWAIPPPAMILSQSERKKGICVGQDPAQRSLPTTARWTGGRALQETQYHCLHRSANQPPPHLL